MEHQLAVITRELCKEFGDTTVVKNSNINVPKGTVYSFLGANGAGKTTIFKIVTGLLSPTKGTATVLGLDVVKNREEILRQVGSLIEAPTFYEHLSASENLEIHLAYMGAIGLGVNTVLEMVGLHNTGKKPVGKFSLGMRQRLGIARALVHKPKLLILDEPINGLDPMGIRDMRNLFLEMTKKHGMTILLSSHILSEIEHTADYIGVIVNGSVIQEAPLDAIKEQCKGSLEDYFFNIVSGGNAS